MTQKITIAKHVENILGNATLVSAQQPIPFRNFILTSWKRCLGDYGMDPVEFPEIPVLESGEIRRYADEHDQLLAIATEEMQHLYNSVKDAGYAVILTNQDGIILHTVSDSDLAKKFSQANLRVGGDWGEKTAGTNGIGTAIAENRSVTVHMNDHFLACNINLTCTGAPIYNPTGDLIAILDASAIPKENSLSSQVLMRGLVANSVRAIENQLIKRMYSHKKIVRFHTQVELMGLPNEALVCLNDDETIIAANDTAAQFLGEPGVRHLIGKSLSRYLIDKNNQPISYSLSKHEYIIPFELRNNKNCNVFATLCELPGRKLARNSGLENKGTLELCSVAGKDQRMRQVVQNAVRLKDKKVNLLLQGETGTGKDVFARAIHNASNRADKPFVAINCASIPESLIESELYGYCRGAFTGARRDGMKGKIEQSDGGTLFLDEIGDMPLTLQTRLLRCVEEGAVVPLGGEKPVAVDLHIISATHRELEKMVEEGEFREDLFYRLNGMGLELSPLRQREDLFHIIQEVLSMEQESDDQIHIIPATMDALLSYPWPGNFRELRNVICTALAMSEGQEITLQDIPGKVAAYATVFSDENSPSSIKQAEESLVNPASAEEQSSSETDSTKLLANAEKSALEKALKDNNWHITNTAKSLSISRNTLYRKMKRHNIQ